jgi:hypothetical protein
MARESPRVAESQVIKAESQLIKEECDSLFINLKVKQQVFFIPLIINIFYCIQDGAIMHFRIQKQGLIKVVVP